ncbi:MAG: RHS repeat-associated core domain-containing protein [Chloroflexi bacterium]|nr:RHS repeat-associated core domain-containing protein [Chloroflexota bacterium]
MKTTPWSTTYYISPLMEKVVPLAGRNLLLGNVITADCQVHMDDLLKMAVAPGVSNTVAYDANGDGLVNVYDMMAAADNWRGNLPGCNNANGITIKYYHLGGKSVAIRSEGNLNYVHTDQLNSVSLLVDNSGKVVTGTVQRFMPFGQERAGQPQSLPTDRNFTGQPLDASTGLLYYGARYYDSSLGRFIQPDTIVPQPGNPQSLNRFSYVLNNPLRYVDPSGHDPLDNQWHSEFKGVHNRDPQWQDVAIRLFSIAFTDEWDENNFYNSQGDLLNDPNLHTIFTTPEENHSWANMPDILTRLSGWYKRNEKEAFVRDVGTLFGGLPNRLEESVMRRAVTSSCLPCYDWAFLGKDGLPQGLIGTDPDANVHHWAWAFVLGYQVGGDVGRLINTTRELSQVGWNPLEVSRNPNSQADIGLGNRAASMGSDVYDFGASPDTVRSLYYQNILGQ